MFEIENKLFCKFVEQTGSGGAIDALHTLQENNLCEAFYHFGDDDEDDECCCEVINPGVNMSLIALWAEFLGAEARGEIKW